MQGVDGDTPSNATDWNPSWGWTAGSMISNLDDLLVWGEALATGEGILSPEMQAERLDSFDFDVPVYTGPGSPHRRHRHGPTVSASVWRSTGTATRGSCRGSTPSCSTTSRRASRWS